jgi:hypothetical protein
VHSELPRQLIPSRFSSVLRGETPTTSSSSAAFVCEVDDDASVVVKSTGRGVPAGDASAVPQSAVERRKVRIVLGIISLLDMWFGC